MSVSKEEIEQAYEAFADSAVVIAVDTRLREKYKIQLLDKNEDYPEMYWAEYNQAVRELLEGMLRFHAHAQGG
jgi:hypothetical protein